MGAVLYELRNFEEEAVKEKVPTSYSSLEISYRTELLLPNRGSKNSPRLDTKVFIQISPCHATWYYGNSKRGTRRYKTWSIILARLMVHEGSMLTRLGLLTYLVWTLEQKQIFSNGVKTSSPQRVLSVYLHTNGCLINIRLAQIHAYLSKSTGYHPNAANRGRGVLLNTHQSCKCDLRI